MLPFLLPFSLANDVLALEPILSWCVQTAIVHRVVVTFGQDF